MLEFQLNHVSKRGPWCLIQCEDNCLINIGMIAIAEIRWSYYKLLCLKRLSGADDLRPDSVQNWLSFSTQSHYRHLYEDVLMAGTQLSYHCCQCTGDKIIWPAPLPWWAYNISINSLAPCGGVWQNFINIIFKLILQNSNLGTCCEIAVRWMPIRSQHKFR